MYICVEVSYLGVIGICELPCGGQDLNLGPLEEQPVLSNTELSLQPDFQELKLGSLENLVSGTKYTLSFPRMNCYLLATVLIHSAL